MNETLRLTQLLYSCWIVAGSEASGKQSMPTAPGVLENALKSTVEAGALPEWARRQLHFVDGDAGLVCLELPSIQRLATEMRITSDPNPSYTRTNIIVGPPLARRCLARLGISEDDAVRWGKVLRDEAEKADNNFAVAELA